MTVTELREMLQALEADGKGALEVQFSYNYGDHWRTQVASNVDTVEEAFVTYSDYHSMDKVMDCDADEEDAMPEDARTVVLLR